MPQEWNHVGQERAFLLIGLLASLSVVDADLTRRDDFSGMSQRDRGKSMEPGADQSLLQFQGRAHQKHWLSKDARNRRLLRNFSDSDTLQGILGDNLEKDEQGIDADLKALEQATRGADHAAEVDSKARSVLQGRDVRGGQSTGISSVDASPIASGALLSAAMNQTRDRSTSSSFVNSSEARNSFEVSIAHETTRLKVAGAISSKDEKEVHDAMKDVHWLNKETAESQKELRVETAKLAAMQKDYTRELAQARADADDAKSRAQATSVAAADLIRPSFWAKLMGSQMESKDAGESVEMCSAKQRLCANETLKLYQLGHVVGSLLQRHQVAWWATGGTLLGAVRNKGIIPHDDDVDYNILDAQSSALSSTAFLQDLKKNGLTIRQIHDEFWKIELAETPKLSVDLFAMSPMTSEAAQGLPEIWGFPEGEVRLRYRHGWWWKHTFPKWLCTCSETSMKNDVPVADCPLLTKWPFGTGWVWGPTSEISTQYLEGVYGNDWRTRAACTETNHPCNLITDQAYDAVAFASPAGPLKEPL